VSRRASADLLGHPTRSTQTCWGARAIGLRLHFAEPRPPGHTVYDRVLLPRLVRTDWRLYDGHHAVAAFGRDDAFGAPARHVAPMRRFYSRGVIVGSAIRGVPAPPARAARYPHAAGGRGDRSRCARVSGSAPERRERDRLGLAPWPCAREYRAFAHTRGACTPVLRGELLRPSPWRPGARRGCLPDEPMIEAP
jgi:hypothetical protein